MSDPMLHALIGADIINSLSVSSIHTYEMYYIVTLNFSKHDLYITLHDIDFRFPVVCQQHTPPSAIIRFDRRGKQVCIRDKTHG